MAQKPVPAPELARLHASIGRDLKELRARLARWSARRRGAGARHGIVDRLAANPEDIVSVAFRTFRALRLLQDAVAGAPAGVATKTGDDPVSGTSAP